MTKVLVTGAAGFIGMYLCKHPLAEDTRHSRESKRIPKRNSREFLGKPIIAYSIDATLQSKLFTDIFVSIDDKEISAVPRSFDTSVHFMRSAQTSGIVRNELGVQDLDTETY